MHLILKRMRKNGWQLIQEQSRTVKKIKEPPVGTDQGCLLGVLVRKLMFYIHIFR